MNEPTVVPRIIIELRERETGFEVIMHGDREVLSEQANLFKTYIRMLLAKRNFYGMNHPNRPRKEVWNPAVRMLPDGVAFDAVPVMKSWRVPGFKQAVRAAAEKLLASAAIQGTVHAPVAA